MCACDYFSDWLTSGYTSNRRWTVTGIPARVLCNTSGSIWAYMISSPSSASARTRPIGSTTMEWPHAWYPAVMSLAGLHIDTNTWLSTALLCCRSFQWRGPVVRLKAPGYIRTWHPVEYYVKWEIHSYHYSHLAVQRSLPVLGNVYHSKCLSRSLQSLDNYGPASVIRLWEQWYIVNCVPVSNEFKLEPLVSVSLSWK